MKIKQNCYSETNWVFVDPNTLNCTGVADIKAICCCLAINTRLLYLLLLALLTSIFFHLTPLFVLTVLYCFLPFSLLFLLIVLPTVSPPSVQYLHVFWIFIRCLYSPLSSIYHAFINLLYEFFFVFFVVIRAQMTNCPYHMQQFVH